MTAFRASGGVSPPVIRRETSPAGSRRSPGPTQATHAIDTDGSTA
ncbi:hypothetical protein FTUN_0982 [Frigoriglobus tundricola]|uniref:Uncharacterized protein n=1 Tax=Frigoriglobus tundricola TaxID=2774151 RepID=A0A6M5YJM7_9BACT|nr:hypothetical protein FTUN_0982 [Frigoriglobus tundricola]